MHYRDMIDTIIEATQPSLADVGYILLQSPFKDDPHVYFGKQLFLNEVATNAVIAFQGSGVPPYDYKYWRFAVNLSRDEYEGEQFPALVRKRNVSPMRPYVLWNRLASHLWVKKNTEMAWKSDHWWVFRDKDELVEACREVLDLLFQHGIPYLENTPARKRKEWKRPKISLDDIEIPF